LIFPDSRALAHLGFPDVDLRSYCRIRGKFLFCCFSQNTFFLNLEACSDIYFLSDEIRSIKKCPNETETDLPSS
jgi:hypothetical protein